MATLFWINQDIGVSGIGKSSRAQKAAIQSLVQRGRGRKRVSKTKPSNEEHVRTDALPTRTKVGNRTTGIDQESGPLTRISPTEGSTDLGREQRLRLPLPSMPSSSGSPDDPFNTASIGKIDITAHGLLRYYVYYHHPAMWPDGNGGFKQSVEVIVQTAAQDQLTMFCLLTAAAARLQYVDRFDFPNVRRKEDGYTEKAVGLMRRRVEQKTGGDGLKALVQCMMFLTCAESYREDFAASRMHLEAAFAVLKEQIGGVEFLQDEHIEQQLAMADLFLACVEMRACIYPCFYDPGSVEALVLHPSEVRELGCEQTMGSKLLATELLRDEVRDILETYRIKSSLITTGMAADRAFEIGQWIMKRNMVVRHHLLASKGNDALRAALVMWTLLAMNHTGRIKTVKIMAQNLRDILIRSKNEIQDQDLRLWILLIGYTCSFEGSEDKRWFARAIGKVGRLRILGGDMLVRELENCQRGLLFHAPVQGPATRALVEEIGLLPQDGENFGSM